MCRRQGLLKSHSVRLRSYRVSSANVSGKGSRAAVGHVASDAGEPTTEPTSCAVEEVDARHDFERDLLGDVLRADHGVQADSVEGGTGQGQPKLCRSMKELAESVRIVGRGGREQLQLVERCRPALSWSSHSERSSTRGLRVLRSFSDGVRASGRETSPNADHGPPVTTRPGGRQVAEPNQPGTPHQGGPCLSPRGATQGSLGRTGCMAIFIRRRVGPTHCSPGKPPECEANVDDLLPVGYPSLGRRW